MKKTFIAVIAASIISNGGIAAAQDAGAQANNPLANTTAFNIQNYYIGELTGDSDKDANQFILRYAKPFSLGDSNWLMRLSVPVSTLPVGTNMSDVTDLGDIDVFAAYLFDTGNPAVSFGIGPEIVAPTAQDDRLGNEQWQVGFANVYFNATSSKFQYGYLLTYRNGIGDTNGRERVKLAALQPFGFYQLGQGWYTGSAPAWTFDLDNGDYNIPLGLRLGKVIQANDTVYNMFVEPQYSVAHEGDGQPKWQIFFALNMQF
ncbi:hypothetical protein [Sedimentitalea todarodis]|uniref:Phenol degradation protein meta n=1 Tax=Sedimentitalea todarodis TaxID=1631240 RepID=A0ABU3VH08_9RHOB|nr:hypothetical protein [Sedimentitalea todarodis]MDU9005466.1 hypothetical protein [Sedimentitalea todarodis]